MCAIEKRGFLDNFGINKENAARATETATKCSKRRSSGTRSNDIYGDTNPLPRLIVQRTRDVNGAGHVFHGERTAYVPARDLVSNTRGCDRKGDAFNKS